MTTADNTKGKMNGQLFIEFESHEADENSPEKSRMRKCIVMVAKENCDNTI